MRIIVSVCVVVVIIFFCWWYYWRREEPTQFITDTNFYALSCIDITGTKISFADFMGKKVLIVNTASLCGYTDQLGSLQNLYDMYHDRLVIVWMPCNQFLQQEPENEWVIKQFCEKNYGVTFLLSEKITVFGGEQHPVYQWLTHKSLNGVSNSVVKRNFQKYLISETWQLLTYFSSSVLPFDPKIITYLQT